MITTTIRIKPYLYDMLEKQSIKDVRSINKEICYIIEQYLEMIQWTHKR